MNAIQAVVGGMISMIAYGILFAGVHRLFVISKDLGEIRDLLKKNGSPAAAPDPYLQHAAQLQSAAHEWTVLDQDK